MAVSLPTKVQWVWAARGRRSQAIFPWGSYYLRNNKGERMCNFRVVGDQFIYRNRKTGKAEVAEKRIVSLNEVFTASVKSFFPNPYGLYNMCGNVAEIIEENEISMGGSWDDYGGDVHILAEKAYDRSANTVGFRPVVVVKEKER